MSLTLTTIGLLLIAIAHLAFYRLAYRRGARATLEHPDVLKLIRDAKRYQEVRGSWYVLRSYGPLFQDELDTVVDARIAARTGDKPS